jgi:hypothetical protein
MPRKVAVDKALNDAEKILRVWEANPTFTVGEITLAKFRAQVETLRSQRAKVETKKTELIAESNALNDQAVGVSDVNTRALSGIRADFGPNSTEYEQAGGTRTDERRRPARQAKTKKE